MTQAQHSSDHQPRRDKIPAALQSLEWEDGEQLERTEFYDGDVILAAVPVCTRGVAGWVYRFSVVHIRCDEDYFALEVEGEPWGWDLDCIDWYVRIK